MNKIVDFALSKGKTTLTIALLVLIAGSYSRTIIPVAADPSIQLPLVSVSVFLDGASPNDASRLIAKPLENRLRSVPGIEEISSSSTLGFARLVAEFEVGHDIDAALVDIKQAVEEVKYKLPLEAEDPQIREYSFATFPVMNLSLIGNGPLRQKVFFAKELQDQLEGIDEVLSIDISGAPDEVLEAIIDKSKLETYGITLRDLYLAVSNNNVIIPGGAQDTGDGRFNIEVPGVFETAQDVYSIPVKVTPSAVVTLGDLGEIRRTFKDYSSYSKVNGKDAVTLEVKLREGANAIDAKRAIMSNISEFEPYLPENIEIVKTDDETIWAEKMITELQGNIVTAIFLVMILVVASMGIRVGMLVGLSIPFCFLLTFIVLNIANIEFNFLVMMGLLLGLGMLIDGSIVVTEYADRKISEGVQRIEAYRLASKRMFYPILSSTATTIAAFTPLIFWPGFTGQFMRFLPIAVFIVLSASLVYAMIVVPVLGAVFGQRRSSLMSGESEKTGEVVFDRVSSFYSKWVRIFAKNPFETILSVFFLLSVIIISYDRFGKGTVYFPYVDPVAAEVSIRARGNFSATESKDIVEQVEDRLLEIQEIKSLYLRTGSEWFNSGGDVVGRGFFEVEEFNSKGLTGQQIIDQAKLVVANIPGIIVEISEQEGGPAFENPIEIGIFGNTENEVVQVTRMVEDYAKNGVTGLANISSTLPYPQIEWKIDVDKQKAAQLGVNISDVGAIVQMLTNGFKAGEYRPDDSRDEVEIRVRFKRDERSLTGIDDLKVPSSRGQIPISSFIKIIPKENRQSVVRRNGKFFHEIGAAGANKDILIDVKVKEMRQWIDQQEFPSGIFVQFRGQQEETEEVNSFLSVAGITAIFLMLVLLLTQFNSFYQSILILSAVFMSATGVLLGLLITGQPFGTTMTGIGIVALAGIVVNNNIVLIDTFNRLRDENQNLARYDVVVMACKQRLRPILLTTLTTIFGLLPLAAGVSLDIVARSIELGSRVVDWWQLLAQSIVFGLGFSTILTLIFTPAALMVPESIKNYFSKSTVVETS